MMLDVDDISREAPGQQQKASSIPAGMLGLWEDCHQGLRGGSIWGHDSSPYARPMGNIWTGSGVARLLAETFFVADASPSPLVAGLCRAALPRSGETWPFSCDSAWHIMRGKGSVGSIGEVPSSIGGNKLSSCLSSCSITAPTPYRLVNTRPPHHHIHSFTIMHSNMRKVRQETSFYSISGCNTAVQETWSTPLSMLS